MSRIYFLKKILFVSLIFFVCAVSVKAQSILARNINLNIERQKLSDVLSAIEQKGGFRFSYNSAILPLDSILSIHENNLSISEALDRLLNYRFEYSQSGNFIIIRYAPKELLLFVKESLGDQELYTITGQVIDKFTGEPIKNASIYERNLFESELSNEEGYFTLRLKNITKPVELTVSKENYKISHTYFLAEVNITKSNTDTTESFLNGDFTGIENTWIGRTFITTTQKIQTVNIGGFISKAPFQFSLIPGLNSHGSLSGQVVNKFSFNIIGAYSAGVSGAEFGLLFNIDKANVQYFQFAGAFNMVGGNMKGAQIGGIFNSVMGEVNAVQVALGFNRIAKDFNGFQIAGVFNKVKQNVKGMQVSLGLNAVSKSLNGFQVSSLNVVSDSTRGGQIGVLGNVVFNKANGLQIAGAMNLNKNANALSIAALANVTTQTANGAQVGAINFAKTLKGTQIGLLNISNNNTGYSIGLLNVSLKGYHKIGVGTNETTPINFVYKGGSTKLYNTLMFGMEKKTTASLYAGGWGFGTELKFLNSLSLNPEISGQYVYQGSWDYVNVLLKCELPLNIRLTKWFAIQGGPSVNVYHTDQTIKYGNFGLLQEKHKDFSFNNPRYTGWFGWSVGMVLF